MWDYSLWKCLLEVLCRQNLDNMLMIQNVEEWLKKQCVAVPSTGTSMSWRIGLMGTSGISATGNTKSYTGGGATTCTSTSWVLTGWKAAWQKRTWGSWWRPRWTWGSISRSIFKSESILKIWSILSAVPKVPVIVSLSVSISYQRIRYQYTYI